MAARRLAQSVTQRLRPELLGRRFEDGGQRVQDLFHRLTATGDRTLGYAQQRLGSVSGLLESYSYERVLERGFVLVRDAHGKPVTAAADAHSGERVALRFHDGEVAATVSGAPAAPTPAPRAQDDARRISQRIAGVAAVRHHPIPPPLAVLVFAALAALASSATAAERVTLKGALVQGGLVEARVPPGTAVSVDGRPARLGPGHLPGRRGARGQGRRAGDRLSRRQARDDAGRREAPPVRHPAHRRPAGEDGDAAARAAGAHQGGGRDGARGAQARRRATGLPRPVRLAGHGADQRRLWQPAHPERRAARAALRRRHRRPGRHADPGARGRHRHAGGRSLLHRLDRDPGPWPRAELGVHAPGFDRGEAGPGAEEGRGAGQAGRHRPRHGSAPALGAQPVRD
jgi:hypothetical protein